MKKLKRVSLLSLSLSDRVCSLIGIHRQFDLNEKKELIVFISSYYHNLLDEYSSSDYDFLSEFISEFKFTTKNDYGSSMSLAKLKEMAAAIYISLRLSRFGSDYSDEKASNLIDLLTSKSLIEVEND